MNIPVASEPNARESLWFRIIGLWRRLCNRLGKSWTAIRPGPEARRGAVWGSLAAAAAAVVSTGLFLHTGFGRAFDFAFAALFAAIAIPLVTAVVALLLTIGRHLARMATGIVVACWGLVMAVWGLPKLGIVMALAIGLAQAVLGATIATFVSGAFKSVQAAGRGTKQKRDSADLAATRESVVREVLESAQAAGRGTKQKRNSADLAATRESVVPEFLKPAGMAKKLITVSLCLFAVTANVFLAWLFVHQGSMENLVSWKPAHMPAKLAASNPSAAGPYPVKLLFYGVGTDIRRPEYGSTVGIKTRTVDASLFFPDFGGWKRWARRTYWGFDIDKLPLNARVWYPDGRGPFPLVLIVHGNHNMADFSDSGYAYLGEMLASRGFILASIDENFLNSGLFHDPPKQQAVRGWLLLEHLKLWREWNQAAGNPFHGKVDLNRIALMGHSRGGEAAATAAAFNRMKYDPEDANIKFDYGFDIKSVVAIAPVDGQYKPAGQHRWVEDVSYLTLQGAHDADVASFMGSRQWDHVRYTRLGPWFKAEIYAYRANHGQFNTVWGRSDAGQGPPSWLLNLQPLMPGDAQRRISKTYIAAFLEATLNNRLEYLRLFQDWRVGRDWLPDTIYINRYQGSSYIPLASFQEDADLTSTSAPGGRISAENLSIWHEGRIAWRQGDRDYNGVFLGWNRAKGAPIAAYTVTLPEGAAAAWGLNAQSVVELSVAALDEDAPLPGQKKDKDKEKDKKAEDGKKKQRDSPDFTIELVASDGATATAALSSFAAVPPPLKEKFTKLDPLESFLFEKDWEPVFQSVRAPLMAFQSAASSKPFDPRKLSAVRLKFDRNPMSVICISGLGFETGPSSR